MAQNIANIANKAEIKHSIRFIKHHNLNVIERNNALFHIVNHTTCGADKNIYTLLQSLKLFVIAIAAVR